MGISLRRYWRLKEEQRLAPTPRYDQDVLFAEWNPELPSLLQCSCPTDEEPSVHDLEPTPHGKTQDPDASKPRPAALGQKRLFKRSSGPRRPR